MPKKPAEIDIVPFITAASPTCRLAETVLLFGIGFAGLVAAVISLFRAY